MQINPTNNWTPLPELRRANGTTGAPKSDEASFENSQAVTGLLSDIPEARAEEVARARALIEQSTYPPDETIRKIANLIAMRLDGSSQ